MKKLDKTKRQKKLEKKLKIAIEEATKTMESEFRRLKFNRMCDEISSSVMTEYIEQEKTEVSVENFNAWIEKEKEKCNGKE